ncbi:carboxymuconolactone decarboxylase family protein [Burkholderia pseudomultivorans]|uniref:carboxymuconolactone decarboxylase family protein n=1 Tax=Burkholderia pseudomultivorans TaxID=1207504 RepID=UPI0001FD76CF|nr:carboxymuconolactone decarboxylase family protein [Burkholderia pseudomultivorans]EGD05037.1 carboxymuconolactone decarboxylase [Burkholderia sp. TJI49]AOI90494.1 carboxymuconolactone decarboxylase [Burkholderia pseudomultivorans]KVC27340.1 carboxymuconolactone decarboxylase [Burkholderia pseudomultivorans]KVC37919.1 carboxymuconolactone decarboxylase [Burkholderia pseudomultivorans]MDS0791470.1 carboxymuconolactone decarboxylase family protein [Burkholderia pseudomultivorans]
MDDSNVLKTRFEHLHGFWNNGLESALQEDPAFFASYLSMAEVAMGATHLEPKIRDFVLIAANASVTHLNSEAVSHHVEAAVKHGATRGELREVLQVASVLGIHAYMVGVPILLEALAATGESLDAVFPLDDAFEKVRAQFTERRGYWSDELQGMVRSSPAFFDGYTAFSSAPWKTGELAPVVKELLYVAIDVSTTHLFEPGVRIHTRNALRYGATPAQVLQVMQIVSCVGMQSFLLGVPRLRSAGA